MTGRLIAAALAALLAVGPAAADGRSQLAAGVQFKLNALGFRSVDARSLTLRQLGALHSQLRARNTSVLGNGWVSGRGTARNILSIDGYETFDGQVVQGRRADAPPR